MNNELLKLIQNLKENDGFTVINGKVGEHTDGWQVGLKGTIAKSAIGAYDALKFMQAENRNCDVGVWFSEGIYYIDISTCIQDYIQALALGQEHNQISIFGWKNKELAYC